MAEVISFYTGYINASTGVSSVVKSLDKGQWSSFAMTHSIYSLDQQFTSKPVGPKSNSPSLGYNLKSKCILVLSSVRMWLWRQADKSSFMAVIYFKLFHLARADKLVKTFISQGTGDKNLIVHDIWSLITLLKQGYSMDKIIFVIHGSNDPISFMVDVFPKMRKTNFLKNIESDFLFALSKVKSVVVLSEENRIQLQNKYGVETQLILNGIPELAPKQSNIDNLNLHITGSLCSRKRQYLLVEAIAKLPVNFISENSVKLNIFGHGPDYNKLKRRILELNLEQVIILHGNTDAPYNNYKYGDLILSISTEEGLPVALIEGLRSGCVPVVTDVGGCHLTAANDNGVLLSTFDDDSLINELCVVITELSNIQVRETFASRSLSLFKSSFSNKKMVSLYAKAISS